MNWNYQQYQEKWNMSCRVYVHTVSNWHEPKVSCDFKQTASWFPYLPNSTRRLDSLCRLSSSCIFQVGERLARYDVEKRCAIEKEDYDMARKKKEQMEKYRKSVYQQLEVHNLLDMAMVSHQQLMTSSGK